MKWQSERHGAAAMHSVWSWTLSIVVGTATIAAVGYAIVHGPAVRARAEQLKAEQIDQENRALCQRLGMPHGSDRFDICAGVLSEARQKHGERLAIEAAGIL
jgi:hypothetical protein